MSNWVPLPLPQIIWFDKKYLSDKYINFACIFANVSKTKKKHSDVRVELPRRFFFLCNVRLGILVFLKGILWSSSKWTSDCNATPHNFMLLGQKAVALLCTLLYYSRVPNINVGLNKRTCGIGFCKKIHMKKNVRVG